MSDRVDDLQRERRRLEREISELKTRWAEDTQSRIRKYGPMRGDTTYIGNKLFDAELTLRKVNSALGPDA